ncbi:MAG TPA: tetratricopeptide repeat protein [Anaerolineae bacterium]|nr:tetratricopeptide repeat protein [Anaerolineae bacterium]
MRSPWQFVLGLVLTLAAVVAFGGRGIAAAAWGNAGFVGLARTALQGGSAGSAAQALERARLLAQEAGFARGLGRLSMLQDRQAEAIGSLQEALAACPEDRIAAFFLGQALWQAGEQEPAIAAWRQAGAAPYFVSLGQRLNAAGHLEEAMEAWRLALEIDPQSWQAHLEVGRALRRSRQPEEAIRELAVALDLCPLEAEVQVYAEMGHAYRAARNLDRALWAYRETYARLPAGNAYAYLIGSILYEQGRYAEARQYLCRLLQGTPHAPSHYLLARISIQQEDWAGAERELAQAIALAPSVPEYHEWLGEVYRAQGNSQAAVEAYRAAFCLAPPESRARERIGGKIQALGGELIGCEGE